MCFATVKRMLWQGMHWPNLPLFWLRLVRKGGRRILNLLLYNEMAILHRGYLFSSSEEEGEGEEVCFCFLGIAMFCELLMLLRQTIQVFIPGCLNM